MTPNSVHDIRNLSLLGHTGSGKTTLLEALLAAAGAITSSGSVAIRFPTMIRRKRRWATH